MWCVIPVAGQGTRLRQFTATKPKALIDINDHTIIDFIIERLAPVVTNFCLVVAPKDGLIQEKVGYEQFGIPIHYATQDEPLGVAHAILQAQNIVKGAFMTVMGDNYYNTEFEPYIRIWEESETDGAILVERLSMDSTYDLGTVWVKGNRVIRIEKNPSNSSAQFKGCGTTILPYQAFEACAQIEPAASGEYELEDAILWLINHKYEFLPVQFNGWRVNINTQDDIVVVKSRIEKKILMGQD